MAIAIGDPWVNFGKIFELRLERMKTRERVEALLDEAVAQAEGDFDRPGEAGRAEDLRERILEVFDDPFGLRASPSP